MKKKMPIPIVGHGEFGCALLCAAEMIPSLTKV